jgi:hypothetical protein
MAPQKSERERGLVGGFCGRGEGGGGLTVCGYSPTHANLSVTEREDFGTISERHRPLPRRVECREDEDKQRHKSNVGFASWVNQYAAACY